MVSHMSSNQAYLDNAQMDWKVLVQACFFRFPLNLHNSNYLVYKYNVALRYLANQPNLKF